MLPTRLTISTFAPRELRLTQRCKRRAEPAELSLGSPVALAGLFAGRVVRRTLRRDTDSDVWIFTAADSRLNARRVMVVDELGEPRVGWNLSAGHPEFDPRRDRMPLPDLLRDLFDRHASALAAAGAPAPCPGSDLAALPQAVVPVCAVNADFDSVLDSALRPFGRFAWVDPASNQWRIGDEPSAPVIDVPLASSIDFDLDETAHPGWAALELFGPRPPHKPGANLQMLRLSDGSLTREWDRELEPKWNRRKAGFSDPALRDPDRDALEPAQQNALDDDLKPNLRDNPYTWVHRRFRLPQSVGPDGRTFLQLLQRTNPLDDPQPRWEPVAFRFDRALRRVIAHLPMLSGGNPRVPGAARPAYDVALTFEDPAPEVAPLAPLLRVPEQGFAGESYARLGSTAVLKRFDPLLSEENKATYQDAYASQLLELARIPVSGELAGIDPAFDFRTPGRRVRPLGPDGRPLLSADSAFVREAVLELGPSPTWRLRL